MELSKKLTKARANLVFDHPFFGAIALRMRMEMKNDMPQKTFGVDGYTIFYDEEFANKLTEEEITGVLAHEVLHVAMLHHTRMQNRNHQLWNIAADFAINGILKQNGFVLPATDLDKDLHKYQGQSAEEIYERILKDMPDPPPGFDTLMPPPPNKTQTAEQDAKTLTNTGIAAAKQAGKMPGGMETLITAAHEAQVDWKERLRDLLTNTAQGDQVWHRPNRRLLDYMYLPHYEEKPTGNLVLAIDSSGSVCDEELQLYASEVQAIMIDNHIEKLTVLYVDTRVQDIQHFEANDEIILKVKGRGGTRFEPAFDWVEEQGEYPDAFIYFTDGYASFPDHPPSYPVIWCMTSNIKAPWGDNVELKF